MSKAKEFLQEATQKFLSKLDDIAKQAFGHFILGWDEESAPAIVAPYKYRYVNKQHGSAYSEFSQYLLDNEDMLNALSKQSKFDSKDMEFIKQFNKKCDQILAAVDGDEDQDESLSEGDDWKTVYARKEPTNDEILKESKARSLLDQVEGYTKEERFMDAVRYSVNSEDPKNARIDTVDRAIQNGFIKEKEIDAFLDWLISKGARSSLKDDYHKLD